MSWKVHQTSINTRGGGILKVRIHYDLPAFMVRIVALRPDHTRLHLILLNASFLFFFFIMNL